MSSKQATQSAVEDLLRSLSGLLGPLSPFTKAIVPAAAALVGALLNLAFTGSFDSTSITIAACGLVLALVVYLVPNTARISAPPAAPPAPSTTALAPPAPTPQPSPTGALTPTSPGA